MSDAPQSMPAGTRRRRTAAKILAALALLATICVPWMIGGTAAVAAALHLPPSAYVPIAALICFNWLARSMKLFCLCRRLQVRSTFARTLAVSLAADFGFMLTPAGVGGYAASVYFLRRIGASASGAAAITAADQLLDALFFVCAVPAAALSLGTTIVPRFALSGAWVALLFAAIALLLLLVWRGYRWALRGGRALPARLHRLVVAIDTFAKRAGSDLRVLAGGGAAFAITVMTLTVLQQLSRYGILWLVFLVLGFPIPFALVFALQTLVVQAAAWTGIPAGGGVAEIALSASFAAWIPAAALASALIIWRVATLYIGLVAGAIAVFWLSRESIPPGPT